jgi:HTH-type transcriptional regulator, competence development regulator
MFGATKITKVLRKLRKERGLSQEKLARLANLSNNTIINIERGENNNPTSATLKKIARALNVSTDKLI